MEKKYLVFDIETSGLNPWLEDCISCICAKTSEGKIFQEAGDNEITIIANFIEFVKQNITKDYNLISFNGIAFDLPFIFVRNTMNDLLYSDVFVLKTFNHIDLMKITKKWISLEDMGLLYNCSLKKSLNGFEAIKLYKEKRFEELKQYCLNDVSLTEEIYNKMIALGTIK